MSKIKDRIPNQQALERVADEMLETSLTGFISSTSLVRQQVVQRRNQLITAVLVLVVTIISFVFVSDLVFGYSWLILVAIGLGVAYYIGRFYLAYRDFAFAFTHELTPLIASVLDCSVRHERADASAHSVESILRDSSLFNESYTRLHTDDIYYLEGERTALVAEIKVEREVQRGKNRQVETLFHGSLIRFTLPKVLNSITYISTSGDKHGFAHNQFWNRLMGLSGISEVKLEWNQFARDLHVASSDQIEARTIFTPDFMTDLHEWWLESRENMRIVLRGNELVMLLPDKDVRLGLVPLSADHKRIKLHLISVLKPLWRTLTLVEDIKL